MFIIQLIIYKMLLSFFVCQDGERVARRGYWGDIINSPYLAFGTESEEEFLFQTSNGQHVRVSELLGSLIFMCPFYVALQRRFLRFY